MTLALVNFKGGVGKSTLASIIQTNLENSVVFNIDNQDAERVNPGETINVLNYMEEENASIDELYSIVNQEFDTIIVDAPGELNEHLIELYDKIDYFIIPFLDERRVIGTTIDTISSLFNSDMASTKKNVLLVHNELMKDDNKDQGRLIKEEIFKDKELRKILNLNTTIFEYTKAVKSMTRTRKSIQELKKENFIAYRIVDNRVKKFMKEIKEFIGHSNNE